MKDTTNIQKVRRFSFIRTVLWMGFTAFGGPQMHLPYFKRKLVQRRKFISEEELIEINAFCSILPGPSTTQTITTIGLKLGGPFWAFVTLLAWVLPGAVMMSILALSPKFLGHSHLIYLQACVAGFLIYAVYSMFLWLKPGKLNYLLFLIGGISAYIFRTPWIFPVGIFAGAILSSIFSKGDRPKRNPIKEKIRWRSLTLFLSIFIIVGLSGLYLNKYKNESKWLKPLVLFENTYRMGALSFGGGNVLAAMSVEQYVHHKKRMSLEELNTGMGLVQAMPGPNFNLAVYTNCISMKNDGANFYGQLLGCIIGMIAVFMPGTLLVFFAYPIWERLQESVYFRRSIDGIFAMSVGFILTACLIINESFYKSLQSFHYDGLHFWLNIFVCLTTVGLLLSKKIPTPFIVLFAILLGWLTS